MKNKFYEKITKSDNIKFCPQSIKITDENEKTKRVLTGCSYIATMPLKNAVEVNSFLRQERIPSRLCEDYTKMFCYDDEYFFAYNLKHDNYMKDYAERHPDNEDSLKYFQRQKDKETLKNAIENCKSQKIHFFECIFE